MNVHRVAGGEGIKLHVVETGSPKGRPILFIHGFSQCSLSWSRQLFSDLADDYRLVAMDLRGHGRSEKPRDGYSDSRLWADDVKAIIESLELDHPVLCGWSYGLTVLDFIRHYGEDEIGGTCLVGAITKIGTDEALSVITPEMLSLVPSFFSTDVEECTNGLRALIRLCFPKEPSMEELHFMLGFNVIVPPYVREAMFTRKVDNDDLLRRIRKPVLFLHGSDDAVVNPSVVDQHLGLVAHGQSEILANTGHAPFWDDAASFNRALRGFAEGL